MKTACEEAAEHFESMAMLSERTGSPGEANVRRDKAKRLRAEGRELKRFHRIALQSLAEPMHAMEALQRESARIQKARKK